jgi:hypothetical protein
MVTDASRLGVEKTDADTQRKRPSEQQVAEFRVRQNSGKSRFYKFMSN